MAHDPTINEYVGGRLVENSAIDNIALTEWRATTEADILVTAAAEDSGLPYLVISTNDVYLRGPTTNADTQTVIARTFYKIPREYVKGANITFRVYALVSATLSSTMTVDLEAFEITKSSAAVGSDICATAVQTISAVAAAYSFTLTGTDLAPGDLIHLKMTLVGADAGAAGFCRVNATDMLLPIRA